MRADKPVWEYPPELVTALAGFGLAPTGATAPAVVRGQLNGLYRHEIRVLKQRLLDGLVAKEDYVGLVIALRKKYWPLSLTLGQWEKICSP